MKTIFIFVYIAIYLIPGLCFYWRDWLETICWLSSRWYNIGHLWRPLVRFTFGYFSGFMVILVRCKNTSCRGTCWKVVVTSTWTYLNTLHHKTYCFIKVLITIQITICIKLHISCLIQRILAYLGDEVHLNSFTTKYLVLTT